MAGKAARICAGNACVNYYLRLKLILVVAAPKAKKLHNIECEPSADACCGCPQKAAVESLVEIVHGSEQPGICRLGSEGTTAFTVEV